ncbi:hypothetical protein [Streptomyces sp. ODS28]|uniref:hypothetical protein n=1 Tax=Streptomyces sp. ODS28 TaxID=3136688 RepID=UPI0031E62782
MSEAQRRNACDRFWRAPGAPAGGSGLGLAIAQQLARAGTGDIGLRPAPGGGLDAVVSLGYARTSAVAVSVGGGGAGAPCQL